MYRISRIIMIAGLLLAANQAFTQANPNQIEQLISQGKLNEALVLTNEQLVRDSENVNYLFLKGLILTRQDKLEQAREVFIGLTEKHPELPEPFNNLAVIYAAQGDYENARLALQKAINTHPSYATAHENLGDIFAKMASRAYNQALELDDENETAREKLLLVNDLFSADSSRQESIIQEKTQESGRLSEELAELEKRLDETRNLAQQESARAEALRKEVNGLQEERNRVIERLQKQQRQAEDDANEAIAKANNAREELSRLEQRSKNTIEQIGVEQQQAEKQLLNTQEEIEKITAELDDLSGKRETLIKQTENAQELAENQLQQLRREIAGLQQTRRELTESIRNDTDTAEDRISSARLREQQIQAEVTKLEQQRKESISQAESERRLILAQVETSRNELEDLKTEIAGLQRQKTAYLENSGSAKTEPVKPASPKPDEQELIDAVKYWSGRWSDQDIEGYLSSYSTNFRPSGGMSRASWISQRRARLSEPRYIRVDVENFRIRFTGDRHAQVLFDQVYRSDNYSDEVEKTLDMQYENGRWLIVEENSD